MPNDEVSRTLAGTWRSLGYGWLLKLDAGHYERYDVCRAACRMSERGSRAQFEAAYEASRTPQGLLLRRRGDLSQYHFESAAQLPRLTTARDARAVFDAAWWHMRENYAFFNLHAVDWEESYRRFAPRAWIAGDDAAALFDVLAEMLLALDDYHVDLVGDGRHCKGANRLDGHKAAVYRTFGVRPWPENRLVYTTAIQDELSRVLLGGRGRFSPNRMMMWGTLAPRVGYLNIMGEFGHADTDTARRATDLPREAGPYARFLADEVAAVDAACDTALAELGDVDALVLDTRLNYGGFDRVALAVAAHFADRTRLAFSKRAHALETRPPEQVIYVEPAARRRFTKRIFVVTSPLTASAGEALVLALRCLPHVTLVGEPTMGILSDNLYKILPNDWELGFSNEIYSAPDGTVFEGSGIPPAVAMPVFESGADGLTYRIGLEPCIELARASRAN